MKVLLSFALIILICLFVSLKVSDSHLENLTVFSCTKEAGTYGYCTLIKTNSLNSEVESEFVILQGNEVVQIEVDAERDNSISRDKTTDDEKESAINNKIETQENVSYLEKQYRLVLLSNDKAYLLKNSKDKDELESQRRKISDFLSNKNKTALNILVERTYRSRYYLVLFLTSLSTISFTSIVYIFTIRPSHLEYKRQNLSLYNEIQRLRDEIQKIQSSNNELYSKMNEFEERSQDLSYECKKFLDEEDKQKDELDTLKRRKNDLLKELRKLNVILNRYEEKFGTKISIGGDMTASTINLGELHGDVQSIINQLEQSDNPKKSQSKKRSK